MKIESIKQNDLLILRILENLDIKSDISELEEVIKKHIKKGVVNIAVSLTKNSRLSSMSIGLLLRCYSTLKENNGKLIIIYSNSW